MMWLQHVLLPEDGFKQRVLAVFLTLWAVSCIRLPHPQYFVLQHVPTVLGVAALLALDRRLRFDRLSYSLVIVFMLLHVLGARYLYSYVPYDGWSEWLLGLRITDYFSFERNHYDRLVHFCFGLLLAYPLWQWAESYLRLWRGWPAVAAMCVVLATSAVYEIIEWGMAMTFAPDWAEAYNGQQGDVWDAQRDMALAFLGAVVGVCATSAVRRHRQK